MTKNTDNPYEGDNTTKSKDKKKTQKKTQTKNN